VLEAAARATGQQLLIYPSTMNSTLGGSLAGGSGGTGSVVHGGIEDRFVKSLDVVHATGDATAHRVEAAACLPYLHAYGTSGVIVAGIVALEPQQDWVGVWASFPRFPDAQAAVVAAAALEPAPRIASADVPELVAAFPPHAGLRPGTASFRAIVDRTLLEQLRTLLS
jgi:FAD/FMN-containing dehydrogenase